MCQLVAPDFEIAEFDFKGIQERFAIVRLLLILLAIFLDALIFLLELDLEQLLVTQLAVCVLEPCQLFA